MDIDDELLNMLTEVKTISYEDKKLYKEFKETLRKFLVDGIETVKVKEIIDVCEKYCNNYLDLLDMDNLTDLLIRQLPSYVENNGNIAIISHIVLLCKISTLYEMFVEKQEYIRKEQGYIQDIENIDGLKEVLKKICKDNILFKNLYEISHIEEKKLNIIINKKKYFNVRVIGEQKLISLTLEGKKIKNICMGL